MNTTEITTLAAAIFGPVVAYLKVRDERAVTGDKRDNEIALLRQEMATQKEKIQELEKLKEAINSINLSLTRITTLLEMHLKLPSNHSES